MNREQLFKKYNINESHNVWDNRIDNWYSVELYRIMHNGNLPPHNDNGEVKWVLDFLDKKSDMKWWVDNVMSKDNGGSLYLTSKRMVYSLADKLTTK